MNLDNTSIQNRSISKDAKNHKYAILQKEPSLHAKMFATRKPYESINNKIFHKVVCMETSETDRKIVIDAYKKMALVELVKEHAREIINSKSMSVNIKVKQCAKGTGKKYVYATLIVKG